MRSEFQRFHQPTSTDASLVQMLMQLLRMNQRMRKVLASNYERYANDLFLLKLTHRR